MTLEPSAPIEEVTPPSPVTPEPTPAATLNQVLDQKPVEPTYLFSDRGHVSCCPFGTFTSFIICNTLRVQTSLFD